MTLPEPYTFLLHEPAPRMLVEALKLYGVKEIVGPQHNQVILSWATECGIPGYTNDEIAWCGLAMAVVAKRAGKPLPINPLWARNWAKWGDKCDPELGCLMVYSRPGGGGHVNLYVGEDATHYHGIGGNQANAFNIARLDKTRCIASRNCYLIKKPDNVRKIIYPNPTDGVESVNEG